MFDMATAMGSSSQMSFIKSDQASVPMSPSLCSPNKLMSNTDSRSSFDSMSPSTPGSIDTSNIKQEPGSMSSDLFDSKCKRKISFSQLGLPPRGHPPATVARRNARERNRVKQVNNGFAALKQHIPLGHRSKKMSKVETLRCAVDYIKNLQGLLDAEGNLIQTASSQNISSSHHRNIAEGSYENRLQHFSSNTHHQATPKVEVDNNGYNNNNHHHHHHHHNHNQHPNIPNQLSPASSEDPPSPSYPSQGSYVVSASLYDCENYEPGRSPWISHLVLLMEQNKHTLPYSMQYQTSTRTKGKRRSL